MIRSWCSDMQQLTDILAAPNVLVCDPSGCAAGPPNWCAPPGFLAASGRRPPRRGRALDLGASS